MNDRTDNPTLSVVVNNFNYARFLVDALDRALEQLHACDELVIVDDGSTDESPTLLQRYAERPGVRVIRQENQGQMKAVRTGVDAARCDIIVLLDSDDYFLPGYLDRLRTIYRENPEVDYVFCGAEVGVKPSAALRETRGILDRMELSPGLVGGTRWATIMFYEYVGVPTSGNSLTNALAKKIMTLPTSLDMTSTLPMPLARLLRISETEAKKSGLTADGVIVRAASILGANKYYDPRPGFMYRIHGGNKYATVSLAGRRFLRHYRRAAFLKTAMVHFDMDRRPTARELHKEIISRSFGLRMRRFLHIRARYVIAVCFSSGSFGDKIGALRAVLLQVKR